MIPVGKILFSTPSPLETSIINMSSSAAISANSKSAHAPSIGFKVCSAQPKHGSGGGRGLQWGLA